MKVQLRPLLPQDMPPLSPTRYRATCTGVAVAECDVCGRALCLPHTIRISSAALVANHFCEGCLLPELRECLSPILSTRRGSDPKVAPLLPVQGGRS